MVLYANLSNCLTDEIKSARLLLQKKRSLTARQDNSFNAHAGLGMLGCVSKCSRMRRPEPVVARSSQWV